MIDEPGLADDIEQLTEYLNNWQQQIAGLSWYQPSLFKHSALSLQPLRVRHAPAVWYQYRDPVYGINCGLPAFNDQQQVCEWIEQHTADPQKYALAIMHEYDGFVGVVIVHRIQDCARFTSWLGVDYQGTNYEREIIDWVFTSASQLFSVKHMLCWTDKTNQYRLSAFKALGLSLVSNSNDEPYSHLAFYQHKQLPLTSDFFVNKLPGFLIGSS